MRLRYRPNNGYPAYDYERTGSAEQFTVEHPGDLPGDVARLRDQAERHPCAWVSSPGLRSTLKRGK
jgi:hypothetical protein